MIEPFSTVPVFDFGGVATAFSCSDERFMNLVHERYGAFLTPEPPAMRISYEVDGNRAPDPHAIHAARQQLLRTRRRGMCFDLEGGSFRGEWDQAAGTAEIRGPLATYPVDRFIEAMVYAVSDDVVIFHAAALVFAGQGLLCCGPSGSGKSTLAALFPDHAVCDEHTVVRFDGPIALLSALPFWKGRRGTAPLAAIYLLKHASQNRRSRLSPGDAATRLRQQVVWPTLDDENLRQAFETFCRVLERIPIWELEFRPEIDVRRVLTHEAGE